MQPKPKQFRRCLRKESTTAEKILWFHFRNRKFLDLKIRRQHTIENFVVDFYIDELKLIIEVDGSVHDDQGQSNYDYFRDQVLMSKGYSLVRIDNASVIDYTEAALEWIMDEIRKLKLQIKKNNKIAIPTTLSASGISPRGRERLTRTKRFSFYDALLQNFL